MTLTYRYKLHSERVLWPDHKPLPEVLDLQATTPEPIWLCTYQGVPSPMGGRIYHREWWDDGRNRFDPGDITISRRAWGRWVSWDTAMKDNDSTAYTVGVVFEGMLDYSVNIRHVWRKRVEFTELADAIESLARTWNFDGKLRNVILEDRVSGTSAFQTLQRTGPDWLIPILVAWDPAGVDKVTRASQGAVWCKLGCVKFPFPGELVPWLPEFELELWDAPNGTFMDQVDAFSQGLLFLEPLLSDGWRLRGGRPSLAA